MENLFPEGAVEQNPFEADNEVFREIANPTAPTATETLATVAFSPVGVALGAADTVLQSVNLIDDNDLQNGLRNLSPTVANLYKDNRTGFRFAGDIATTFVGAGLATKALRAKRLISGLDRAIDGGSKSAKLFKDLVISDTAQVDRYVNLLTKQSVALGKKGVRNPLNVDSYRQLRNQTRLKQFTNDLKEGVAAEAFIGAFQNESELFFPEGQSNTDLAVGAVFGLGIGNVIGQAVITPALKKSARAGGTAAGERGVEFTVNDGTNFIIANGIEQEFKDGTFSDSVNELVNKDPSARGQINNQITEAKKQKIDIVTRWQQASPINNLTQQINSTPSQGKIDTLSRIVEADPRLGANIISVEEIDYFNKFQSKSAKLSDELTVKKQDLLKEKKTATGIEEIKINNQIEDINRQVADLNGAVTPVKVNRLGLITADTNTRTVFDDKRFGISEVPREVKGESFGKSISFVNAESNSKLSVGTDIAGTMFSKSGKKVSTVNSTFGLGHYHGSQAYASHSASLKKLGKVLRNEDGKIPQPTSPTRITKNAPFEQLDYAVQALRRFSENNDFKALSKVIDLSDFKDVNEIKFTAMQKKLERFERSFKRWEEQTRLGIDTGDIKQDLSVELMLPMGDVNGTSNFVLEWFTDVVASGNKSIGKNYNQMMDSFTQHFGLDTGERTTQAIRADNGLNASNLFDFDYVKELERNQESFAINVRTNSDADGLVDEFSLSQVLRDNENFRQQDLIARIERDSIAGPILKQFSDTATAQQELVASIKGNVANLNQGAGTNPLFSKLGKLGVTQESFDNRGVAGAGAADVWSDITQRQANTMAVNHIENNMKNFTDVLKPGSEDQALEVLLYISAYRQGWEMLPDSIDELGRIRLDPNSARNKRIVNEDNELVQSKYGGEVPEFLPDLGADAYTPLRLSQKSSSAIKELNAVSDIKWSATNTLARNLGNTGINYRNGHIPNPRSWEERIFITDNTGRVVEYVTGKTPKQARAEALKLVEDYNKRDKQEGRSGGYGLVDRSNIEKYKMAQHQSVDSSALRFGNGEQAKAAGSRSSVITDIGYLQSMLDETKAIFSDINKDYTKTLFASELENIRSLQRVADVDNKGLTNLFTGEQGDSFGDVFTSFTNLLLGDNQRNIGSLYGSIGNILDETFSATWNEARDLWTKVVPSNVTSKNINEAAIKYAEKNNHNPIEYAANIAARSVDKGVGLTSDKIVRKLAGLTTGLALKWGEVGHAALTIASIMTTTPHAIRFAKRLPNESADDYAIRVGHTHDLLDSDNALPNPTKLTMNTIMKRFNGDYADVLKRAGEKGYLDAKLSEFIDNIAVKRGGKLSEVLSKADNALGYVSTKSEDWARETAFLTAYEMFSRTGKNSDEISMAMANSYANKAIADYRPHQRAELFKGTSGVPLAMFQTFAINYFQRLASSIENKAYGAAFTQAGTQAMMFGAQSVPGWEVFNEALLENWNETRRPEDLLREGFKNENLGRLMLYGTPTALPMLLGLDNGVALHNRGEMTLPRNVTPFTMFNTPFFSMATKSAEALKRGFTTAASNPSVGGADALREGLIFATANRPLRGLLDVVAQGYSTNANGDIINDELDGIFNQAIHIAGLKTVREAEKGAALWRDRQRQLSERAAMQRLNNAFVAKIRSVGAGNLTGKDLETVVVKYLENNGSERSIKSWIKRSILKAEISKADREVLKAINTTKEGRNLKHFLGLDEN